MKWTSKGKKKTFGIKRFFNSFIHAFSGIISALKTEQNLIYEFIIGILAIILGILLKLSITELVFVLLVTGLVISMELVNTSIEYVVDMSMPEIHPLAKLSKDISGGAVLFSSIIALIIGLIIYLPKIIELF